MQIILNENRTKEKKGISYLEIDGKRVYYKEIVHPLDFIKFYRDEKPTFEFPAKVTVDTKRPFVTFKSKDRKSIDIKEEDVVLVRICNDKQEAELITKVYKWGKIHIPKDITKILEIKNHENINIKILSKATCLTKTDGKIDLAQIVNYDKNVKIIPRADNFITIYYKQKVSVTLPRFVKLSPKLIELLFLIHGDGHYKSKLFFVNKSPELHKFVLEEFENIFRLPQSAWKSRILLFDLSQNNYAKEYWKNSLELKDSQFYNTSKSTLNTDSRGNLRIIIDKTLFSLIFRFVFDEIKSRMNKEIALHALNGLLCAEGGAQIGKIGLHKITLSFSQQEKELFKEILSKTGVISLCKEEQNSRFVIQGWSNLYSFFKILLSNGVIPFRFHSERRNNALKGFLNHGFTKTMFKYLSAINKNNKITVERLSRILKIRKDSILDALRKEQYTNFIKIEGRGVNRNPFLISITEEGKGFLGLIDYMNKVLHIEKGNISLLI